MELEQHSEEKKFIGLIDKVFEIIKLEYKVNESEVLEKIQELKSNFRYDQGRNWEHNDFTKMETLCAFFYRYSPYTAISMRHVTLQAIEHCEEFRSALNKRDLRVVNLGGGAGADLAGFLSALRGDFEFKTLHITVVDWVKGWEPFNSHIMAELRKESYGNASDIQAVFRNYDVSKATKEYTGDLKSADVVIMRNLLSIVQGLPKIDKITEIVCSGLQPGALLFYIDSRKQNFYGLEPLSLPPTSTAPYDLPFDIADDRQHYSKATFHIFKSVE